MRYEDVTQDGRVHLASLMAGLTAVWRTLTKGRQMQAMIERGVLPILSRIVMLGDEGPFSPHVPLEVQGTWRLAREEGGERLFLDMWLEAHAPHASTFAAPPPPDAPRSRVGRVYAEHVITRPFAKSAAERKVTRLEVPGLPELPEHAHPHEDAASLVADRVLEPAKEHVFGLMHTDSNKHVNSLVYPRLFEEAAATRAIERRIAPHPERLLARAIELRFRKPFFAGERAALALALAAPDGAVGAVGTFAPAGDSAAKPNAAVAMMLRGTS